MTGHGNKPAFEKRYYAFSDYLKATFGCKVYKVTIDAGFTCPNRDGTFSTGGCIYCNNAGFSPNSRRQPATVSDQVINGMEILRRRYKAKKFIAYFQAYTSTYAPVKYLEPLYHEAIAHEDIAGISIGTRPDCVPPDVIDMIAHLCPERETWIELGLQSCDDASLARLNRGHTVAHFEDAMHRIKQFPNIKTCAHIILGIPWESRETMLQSATFISDLGVDSVKIHLLHILRDTPLEDMYNRGEVTLLEFPQYISLACDYLERLDSRITIQRLTADGPSDMLIAPSWANEKKRTIDKIEKELLKRDTRQGAMRPVNIHHHPEKPYSMYANEQAPD